MEVLLMLRLRRSVLKGTLAAGAAGLLSGGAASATATTSAASQQRAAHGPARAPVAPAPLTMRWLGVAGWELTFGGGDTATGPRRVLFDPYFSRMRCLNADGKLDPSLPLRLDETAVAEAARARLTGAPELILVSHGHFDHLADVPRLLAHPEWRDHRIRTLCDDSSRHLLTALGAPEKRVADVITVRGGEYLQFDGFTVQVFRSLHSQGADHGYFAPGRLVAPPPTRPTTLGELPEGETLMYAVTVEEGPTVLLSGASNYIARELAGLRPDVAVVGMTSHSAVHGYLERLLEVLGDPPLLIPSHHDDMVSPLTAARVDSAAAAALSTAVSARPTAPRTRVLDPRPYEPLDITAALST
ncbi:MBL fold metallo-hydrolase [Streptomyces sp. NPDC002133]|uniref:MBL fold metallo-hydrolase n=1 Tax=Streptomyces sp. NPDC002133 TaxID=3154409 RepID=UPI003326AF83